jgi:rhodanese-related sulfurtransferase
MLFNKKTLSLLLALLLAVSLLAGCAPATEATPEPVEEPAPVEAPVEEPEKELDAAEVIGRHTAAYFDSITEDRSTWNMISFENALPMIEDNPEAVFVIDMRTAEDYEAGHLPGAVHIPYGQIGEMMDRLPTNRQLLVYCFTGQTSGQAIAAMQLMGFNALSIQGGMNFGWALLELGEDTLETETNELPDAKDMNWDDEQEILLAAIKEHFTQGTNFITRPPEIHELLTDNPGAIDIIDMRAADDYANGHIEGAVHIPFGDLGERMNEISSIKPVYLACYSGQTAGQATLALRLNGLNIMPMYRGMAGWNGEELPVVTD